MANPVLNSKTFSGSRVMSGEETMSIEGTVNKTGLLLLICLATASWVWAQTYHAIDPSVARPWMFGGAIGGLALIAVGIGVAGGVALASGTMQAGMLLIVALLTTALLVGAGVGLATPVAFSHLAASTPEERMGRTMGSAELGRELGDAGGPLVAGAVGTASVPGVGLIVVAALTAGAGAQAQVGMRQRT